jgi:hypothetical protein
LNEIHDTTPSGGGGGSLPQTADQTPTPTTPSETAEQPTTTVVPTIIQAAFTGVSEAIETSTDGTASVTSVAGTTGKFSNGALSGSKIKKVVVSGLTKKEFKKVEKKLRKSGYKGKIVSDRVRTICGGKLRKEDAEKKYHLECQSTDHNGYSMTT